MEKPSRLLMLAVAIAAALLFSGCADTLTVPASQDVLRIGVTPNSPPMIYKGGGEITGLEVDFGKALAAEMGKSPRFIERKWSQLLPSLQAGQVDIVMSNMTITADRRALADFSKPYLQVGQMILVRNSDYHLYQDPRFIFLTNGRIGVEQGTVSDSIVQQNCVKATRVPLKNPDQAIEALEKGRIDVFIHDAPVIWSLAARGEGNGIVMVPTPLGSDYLGWAVRRGDSATLNAANAAISKWRSNGQLAKTVNRWIPVNR